MRLQESGQLDEWRGRARAGSEIQKNGQEQQNALVRQRNAKLVRCRSDDARPTGVTDFQRASRRLFPRPLSLGRKYYGPNISAEQTQTHRTEGAKTSVISLFRLQLSFQLSDAFSQWKNGFLHFGNRVTRCDVLLAVPIERDDFDKKYSLHDTLDIRRGKFRDQFRMFPRVLNSRAAKNFQPRPVGLIH